MEAADLVLLSVKHKVEDGPGEDKAKAWKGTEPYVQLPQKPHPPHRPCSDRRKRSLTHTLSMNIRQLGLAALPHATK